MRYSKMMSMFAALLLNACLVASQATFDYCTISTSHTMCLYKPDTPGPACVDFVPLPPTAAEKQLIVDTHNALRRKVAQGLETLGSPGPQPSAANMRELTWDDELARIAQTWANQCTFAHDISRDVARFSVGQNLHTALSSVLRLKGNWTKAIYSWYNEVKGVSPAHVASFPTLESVDKVIGHYTALAWATTHKVGCGMARFYNKNYPQYPYQIIAVCNYGPAGNIIGYPIYQTGAPGSACPQGTVNNNGLCAATQ